jgi:hypothetical protein
MHRSPQALENRKIYTFMKFYAYQILETGPYTGFNLPGRRADIDETE